MGVSWLPAPSPPPLEIRSAGKSDFIYFHTREGVQRGAGGAGRAGKDAEGLGSLLSPGLPRLALGPMTRESRSFGKTH